MAGITDLRGRTFSSFGPSNTSTLTLAELGNASTASLVIQRCSSRSCRATRSPGSDAYSMVTRVFIGLPVNPGSLAVGGRERGRCRQSAPKSTLNSASGSRHNGTYPPLRCTSAFLLLVQDTAQASRSAQQRGARVIPQKGTFVALLVVDLRGSRVSVFQMTAVPDGRDLASLNQPSGIASSRGASQAGS
jgi:hypothetical protein